MNELDANDTKFRILSNRDYLENGYKVREERSDPAMRIKLRTDQKKREAKHKAAVAKANLRLNIDAVYVIKTVQVISVQSGTPYVFYL